MEISSDEISQHTTASTPLVSSSSDAVLDKDQQQHHDIVLDQEQKQQHDDIVLDQEQKQQHDDIVLDQEQKQQLDGIVLDREQKKQEQHDYVVPESTLNHGEVESKLEISQDEVTSTLHLIASTGKFWIDWDKLKIMLSFQLKQVLSEYVEAKINIDQQRSALGETFLELMQRLDSVLCGFYEGPPFTLQRLCEILLTARNIYPNLKKLALALEKNLLVTSTLTRCSDPCPPLVLPKQDAELETVNEEIEPPFSVASNGVEAMVRDGDEIMAEVEESDTGEAMTIDTKAFEEKVGIEETAGPTESNPIPDNINTEQPPHA